MEQTKMLELNKKCWDVVAPHFFQVDCLPKYGPYTASEDEIHLFDSIENKTVLDIGCGSGHSLRYMAEHDANDRTAILDIKPYIAAFDAGENVRVPDWMNKLMQDYF
ncbi:hypothetical protein [Bacillus sp. H1a]|uniref:hypothetical protein n=1 Tax=Bacillus paramycoides TaxID=2026194 RepID=UPI0009E03AAC